MTAVYFNTATFTIARNDEHGLECFGMAHNARVDYFVTQRGAKDESFSDMRTARLYFSLVNARLDAEAEKADFQRRALHAEQPD